MVESRSRITDEVFQSSSFQVTRHDFAFCVGSKWSRITNLATKFNTSYRGLQIVRVRQPIVLDLDRIVSVGSRQTDTTSALGPHNTSEQCPGIRRWVKFGGCLGTAQRYFHLASLQIRSIEAGITLPEVGGLAPVVSGSKRLLIFPNTTDGEMVLKVSTYAGKVLYERDSETSQLVLVANSR